MKALVQHYLTNNWPTIARRSLANCHIVGMDSIVLYEAPPGEAGTIRLFYARAGHTMFQNSPACHGNLSVGFHPHHCNVTLVPIFGTVFNWTVEIGTSGQRPVKPFLYQSKIKTGKAGFIPLPDHYMSPPCLSARTLGFEQLSPNGTRMKSSDIHSVWVPHGEYAAWFVFEGDTDLDYSPVCWSNVPLDTEWSADDLYKPMESHEIWQTLRACDLL